MPYLELFFVDLIVRSKSGTGKTLVFGILTLEMIDTSQNTLQALILAPTREIAVQIQDVIKSLSIEYKDLKVESFIGGLPLDQDILKLQCCHIAVGAPGRVKHLIEKKVLHTDDIRVFVLDEADKLMDATFQADINHIYFKLPERKQMIAASATYPNELDQFLAQYMQCPTYITSENETPVLLGLKQYAIVVKTFINTAQQTRVKNDELNNILSKIPFTQCLIFTNYQTLAESISNILNQKGWSSTFISAAQKQNKRLEAVNTLKNFECRILLSTDLTARGIDAANVDLVINYGVPRDAVTYLHRMGRAGRYGARGTCITLCNDGKELEELRNILGVIGGSEMSIVRLPPGEDLPTDLENCDFSAFERISGVIDQNKLEESCSTEVRSSVWNLKTNKVKKDVANQRASLNGENLSNSDLEINPDLIKNVLEDSNNKTETINEQLSNLDLFSLLQSIAGEKNGENSKEELEKTPTVNEVDSKKRKRRQKQKKSPITTNNNTEKNNILEKNIALLNIAKLLTSDDDKANEELPEIAESIAHYSERIKTQDESRINKRLEKDVDPKQLLQQIIDGSEVARNSEENDTEEDKRNDQDVIENIFVYAYDYACNNNETHWLQYLSKAEQNKFEEFCKEPQTESSEEDELMDFSEYSAHDEEIENCTQQSQEPMEAPSIEWKSVHNEEDACNSNDMNAAQSVPSSSDTNNLQWVNARNSNSADSNETNAFVEQFRPYFEQCSNDLWNNALTFENAEDFERWFAQWQEGVRKVRDYVQQNVYVREMSTYQQNKRNE